MLTVYKYPIPVEGYFSLDLPRGAKILTIQAQYDEPVLWALVSPELPNEIRQFRLAWTGHQIKEPEESLHFIGTFQLIKDNFTGHLFELKA